MAEECIEITVRPRAFTAGVKVGPGNLELKRAQLAGGGITPPAVGSDQEGQLLGAALHVSYCSVGSDKMAVILALAVGGHEVTTTAGELRLMAADLRKAADLAAKLADVATKQLTARLRREGKSGGQDGTTA